MNNDDVMDLDILDQYDRGDFGKGQAPNTPRRGRTQTRAGHSSLLWMIRYEAGQPVDPDDMTSPTKLQMLAKRLLDIALVGDENVALRAIQLLLAYFEGAPQQLIQFEIVQAAKTIAENRNLDAQALIERAERIAAEAGMN